MNIIIKVDFDNLENSSSDAIYTEIIGYVETIEDAEFIINQLDAVEKYKGWNNISYPYFKYKEIKKLEVNNEN